MPRHKRHDRPVLKKLSIRASLVAQVDASLKDPVTQEPEFGSWSEVVQELLEGWLDGKHKISRKPFRAKLDDLL